MRNRSRRRFGRTRALDERSMARIVQKFGGTSVADIERIRNAAAASSARSMPGNEVAVVVSAMAGATNQLVDWTRQMSRLHDAREYDVVVAVRRAGDRRADGARAAGCSASTPAPGSAGRSRSAPTACTARRASRRSTPTEIDRRFAEGQVAVVAGLPGHRAARAGSRRSGRGGSDTSAVALAAALEGRPLRYLHRCRRRLHDRSAHRCEGPQARVESPTRRCWRWRRRAPRCCRRARSRWR